MRGLSVLEVIISTAVAAVVITTVMTMVIRSFTPPRQQFEQGRTTEEARVQLNRVSDIIRNAVNVDFNGNGTAEIGLRQEAWLQYGDDNEIIVYALRDVGGNERLEQVRLWLEATDLKMEVKAVTSGRCFTTDSTRTIARGVRNITEDIPLFSYYYDATLQLAAPATNPNSVKRVRIDLVIDTDLQQAPAAARIRTEVKPRLGEYMLPFVGTPAACADCVDNDLDGRVDLGGVLNTVADPGCNGASDTSEKGTLQCDDGFDNDFDTTIDYTIYGTGDKTCTSPAGVSEGVAPQCADGLDNDSDGATDWPADFSCVEAADNDEALWEAECQNGIDDDGDGFTDMVDRGCASLQDNTELCVPGETAGVAQCSDGVDNDCDGLVDFPLDIQCANAGHENEWSTNHQCNDNIDNDGNGLLDFVGSQKDPKCASSGDKSEFQIDQQ